jgi:hypothetical protein
MARYGHRIEPRDEQPKGGEVYRKMSPHTGYFAVLKITGDDYAQCVTLDESDQITGTASLSAWDLRRREVAGYVTDARWNNSNSQLEIVWRAK